MAYFRQWLFIAFALALGGGPLLASQQRDFTAAASAFQDGMWARAEAGFADFVQKHPTSDRVPQALLMEAQAMCRQAKYPQAIQLLQTNLAAAGSLADQYTYWTAQAEFENADYPAAAETFGRLSTSFPGSQWRLDAVVNEAATRAKLNQWPQVAALLQKPDDIFQSSARTNATDDRVLKGQLLLAQALLAENHPRAAMPVLESATEYQLDPELDWQRLLLLDHAELAVGDTTQALALTTNLMAAAGRANRPDLLAQSVAEQAAVLEKIGRLADAAAVYEENLTNNAPDDWQRQAILKIAGLSAAQTNFAGAEDSLQNFLSRFPNSREDDSALLGLGELHLKDFLTHPAATNSDLPQAQSYFNQLIDTDTNSSLLGKAYFDRGWCFWIERNWPESADDFQQAIQKLPPSIDLAVAHFKLGDAQFRENDLANARENYQTVVTDFTNFPAVRETLGAQALYQSLLISVQLQDFAGASNSLAEILKIYPLSNVTEPSILLVGQAMSDLGQPESARALFQKFEEVFPNSPQLPGVELAKAQTYEQENNWPMAISIYDSWLKRFLSDVKQVGDVKYAQAWATFQAGRETNAFQLFTNFVATFPTNTWAPVAQWWLGDYYYGQGNFENAEENYELVFQKWPTSDLAYPAKLMAGRAAMGRQGYDDAKGYFNSLAGDTNCPPELDADALFALGDVLMQEPSPDPNNPLANFQKAILYFQVICNQYAGNEQAALAYGEIGNCYLQLASQAPHFYSDATNAYVQVMISPTAEVAARSQAELGLGLVFEKRAALDSTNQTVFLQMALNDYLDVFFGNNLRQGESADPFWVKEAGLDALPLMETLGIGDPNKFINQMEALLPEQKDFLEKKRLALAHPKTVE